MMLRIMTQFVVGCALCALGGIANADTFAFSYTFESFSGTGQLEAIANGDGSYTANVGSTIFNGIPLSLVPNPDAPNWVAIDGYGFDNQIFPGQPVVVSGAGLLFEGSNIFLNIGFDSFSRLYYYALYSTGPASRENQATFESGSVELSRVPEPGTLPLFAIALIALVLVQRLRHGGWTA